MDGQSRAEVFQRVVVAPAITRAILDSALPPGTALPTEQALSERFQRGFALAVAPRRKL